MHLKSRWENSPGCYDEIEDLDSHASTERKEKIIEKVDKRMTGEEGQKCGQI